MYNRQYFYKVLIHGLTNLITFQIRAMKLISNWQEKLIKWERHYFIAVSVHDTLPHIHGQLIEESHSYGFHAEHYAPVYISCSARREAFVILRISAKQLYCSVSIIGQAFPWESEKKNPLDFVLNRTENIVSCVPKFEK